MNNAYLKGADGAPRTPLEQELQGMWQQILDVPAVGIHDDFFDLGGHSLLALELRAAVRCLLQAPQLALDPLRTPTIATMSAAIHAEIGAGAAA